MFPKILFDCIWYATTVCNRDSPKLWTFLVFYLLFICFKGYYLYYIHWVTQHKVLKSKCYRICMYWFFFTAGTCSSKCNVQINNVEYQHTYYLREVNITIGTQQTFSLSICKASNMVPLPMDMYIECPSWNKSKWHTNAFTMNCDSLYVNFKYLQKQYMKLFYCKHVQSYR